MAQSLAEMGRRGRESAEAQQKKSGGKPARKLTGSDLSSGPRAEENRRQKHNKIHATQLNTKQFRAYEARDRIQGRVLASRREEKANKASGKVED